MIKAFHSIKYEGGLTDMPQPTEVKVMFDTDARQMYFKSSSVFSYLNFEDIKTVSLDEQKSRNAGKAAAGAIVGGLLTGGIGLLAGAAIGGRKKNDSTIYITHEKNETLLDIRLKASGQTNDLYAFLSSAISQPVPEGFDYSRKRI